MLRTRRSSSTSRCSAIAARRRSPSSNGRPGGAAAPRRAEGASRRRHSVRPLACGAGCRYPGCRRGLRPLRSPRTVGVGADRRRCRAWRFPARGQRRPAHRCRGAGRQWRRAQLSRPPDARSLRAARTSTTSASPIRMPRIAEYDLLHGRYVILRRGKEDGRRPDVSWCTDFRLPGADQRVR